MVGSRGNVPGFIKLQRIFFFFPISLIGLIDRRSRARGPIRFFRVVGP